MMHATNAQGNYRTGRGADGLGAVYETSRFGTGVPMGDRPASLTMRRDVPASLRPTLIPQMSTGVTVRPSLVTTKLTPGVRTPTARPRRRRRVSKGTTIRSRRQFLNWIKDWAPQLYVVAKRKADQEDAQDNTLGSLTGWFDTFTDSLTKVGGQYLQLRTQKDILDAQMERMKQGLPPLQTSEYAPTVAVKPDAGTTREITGAIGAGFGSMLPWIAGGIGLMFLMGRKRR